MKKLALLILLSTGIGLAQNPVPMVGIPGAVFTVPKICSNAFGASTYCPSKISDNGSQLLYNGSPVGGGGGSVTNFTFPSTLGSLFTCSVATPTTTPVVTCAVTNAAANTVYGNFTGSSTTPGFSSSPIFNGSGLTNLPFMSLTTTGSGAATLSSGVLNVPSVSSGSETVTSSATPTFSASILQSVMTVTANVTTFTLAAGADGQEKNLVFCQNGTGGFTVVAPSNVHGFISTSVGQTASKCSAVALTYVVAQSAWLTLGAINE